MKQYMKTFFISICILFFMFNLYAEEKFSIHGSNYSIQFEDKTLQNNFRKTIIPESFLMLFEDGTQTINYSNKTCFLTVSKGVESLTYDIGKILFDEHYSKCRVPEIAFFPQNNYLDIVYYDSLFSDSHRFKIIRYDFQNNQIKEYDNYQISHLFYCLFRENKKNGFAKEIYERIFKNKILEEDKYACYSESEPLSYDQGSGYIYTEINENIILQNPYSENGVKFDYYINKKKYPRPSKMINLEKYLTSFNYSHLIKDAKYFSKSFLKEGEIEYKVNNLNDFNSVPFVPSLSYKDEEIIIKCNKKIGGLLIFNGFYHQDKPNLFTDNNRPKEIEIIYKNSYNLIHRVILEDIQQEQFIPLININESEIKIKIVSVYKGTKYNDTCINCIIPMGLASENEYFNSQM